MNKLLQYCIESRLDIIIRDFDYEHRRIAHPEECPCNSSGPCHEGELNCFFCYCPWYEPEKPEGGCSIGNPTGKGKYFSREGNLTSNKIWDCTDCNLPHRKSVVEQILRRLFTGELNP